MTCGICRICLSADIKMYSFLNTPQQNIYELLTNYKLTQDGRPNTACYICYSQLQACCRFKEKSQKSEEILTQLFQSGIEILQETVAILNKEIQHNFSVTTIETYNCPKTLIVKEEKVTLDEENTIKTNIDNTKSDPTEIALCRVCLSGVKGIPIKGTSLQTVYEKLTNTKLIIPKRPDTVCYICRCQLTKCVKLVNKLKRSEKIMCELTRNGIELSRETVQVLNSKTKPLLEVASTESLSFFAFGESCTVDLSRDNILSKSHGLQSDTKKRFEANEWSNFKFKCGVCKYSCPGLGRYTNHLRLHALNRQYPCNICLQRYQSDRTLRLHKKAVHNMILQCHICKEKFNKKSSLNQHMNIHTELKVYACDLCNIAFKSKFFFKQHGLTVHGGYKYKCDRCAESFATELRRKMHLIDKHGSVFPYYTCDYCRKQSKTKSSLRKHMRNVHTDTRDIKCEICGKFFKTTHTLTNHMKVHFDKAYKCYVCSKTFTVKYNLAVHLKYHFNEKDFVCEVCAKRFVDKNSLKNHSRVHSKERYTCNECDAKFYRKYFYEEHMQQHKNGFKKYECTQCYKMYPLEGQLRIHMNKHKYPKPQRKVEVCGICKEETKCLKNHMRVHDSAKFSCDVCYQTFRFPQNLHSHRKLHDNKLYECHDCGKLFAKKSYLIIHMSVHSERKPYKCDVCNAAYGHKAKLSQHKRRHWRIESFQCDECGKKFYDKRSLDYHKNTHTIIEKYICDYCYKVDIDKNEFIKHIKSHKSKFKCENCKKRFGEMRSLVVHMKEHKKEKSVCPLCKASVDRLRLRRHYHKFHKGIMAYACNICEEGSSVLGKVYSHYMQFHSKEDRYVCTICRNVFATGSCLKRHMYRIHNKS